MEALPQFPCQSLNGGKLRALLLFFFPFHLHFCHSDSHCHISNGSTTKAEGMAPLSTLFVFASTDLLQVYTLIFLVHNRTEGFFLPSLLIPLLPPLLLSARIYKLTDQCKLVFRQLYRESGTPDTAALALIRGGK